MGPHAREIFVIQHLEDIIGTVVRQLQVNVGDVSVLDRGDGSGLASYASVYPQTVAAVLRAIGQTTGVDVPEILAGKRDSEVVR
jgi:flotillin